MSGLPAYNYPAFDRAARALRAAGYEVENPAENPACDDWTGYMRLSLVQISRVSGLAVLDGWQLSRGATLEVHVAHSLLLPVLPVARWLASAV
jgi:hypothetical protein